MKLILLAVVLFAYLAPSLSNTGCYRMGLIRSNCHGHSASTVFKSIPGPRGPRGPRGKPCNNCGAKNAALLKRVARLEKLSNQCFNKLNKLWQKVKNFGHTKTGPIVLSSKNYVRYTWGFKGNQAWIVDHGKPEKFWVHSPGLAGGRNTISLESVSKPGYFIRHQSWYIYLHKLPKTGNIKLFKKDATWKKYPNRFFKGFTILQSFNYPNLYIRHSNFRLRLWKWDGNHPLFKTDTSFKWTPAKSYRRPPPQRYTYKAFMNHLTWYQARRHCIRQGGDLAFHGMKSGHDRKKVHSKYGWNKSQHYWLGWNDLFQEGDWKYTDGTTVNRATVGWNRPNKEPNGGRHENFGSIWAGTYTLNDLHRNNRIPFICEYPVYKKRRLVYFIYEASLSANQGRHQCAQFGGTLASDGMAFHKRKAICQGMGCPPHGTLILGFNDRKKEGRWVNSSGTRSFTRKELHWQNIHEGNQGRRENCAAMNLPRLTLHDVSCSNIRHWLVCQKWI